MGYSYTPAATDAAVVASKAETLTNTITGTPALASPIVDVNYRAFLQAQADAMLLAVGYQAQDAQFSVGSFSTSSTVFVDVGNGSTTGFPAWTWVAPIAKTYLVRVKVDCFLSAIGANGFVTFSLVVDAATPFQALPETRFAFSEINLRRRLVMDLPIAFTAGSHNLKLQVKVGDAASTVAFSSTFESRCFLITG